MGVAGARGFVLSRRPPSARPGQEEARPVIGSCDTGWSDTCPVTPRARTCEGRATGLCVGHEVSVILGHGRARGRSSIGIMCPS